MIILIDNYDSFTYNLYQYIGEFNDDIKIFRNDKVTIEEIIILNPEKIIISPGPKYPKDAGITIDIIKYFFNKVPILGVCLGHQSIAAAFNGNIIKAPSVFHGKTSHITLGDFHIYEGLEKSQEVMRYHSLIVEKDTLPKELIVTAYTDDGIIMGLKHKDFPLYGVQFHPESIKTKCGKKIIKNFLEVI